MVEIDTDGLAKQNKDTVDLTTLAADTPEVISRQVFYFCKKKVFIPASLGYNQCWYDRSRSTRKVYCCEGHFRLVFLNNFTAYARSDSLIIRPLL